jgi:hypothetical protein
MEAEGSLPRLQEPTICPYSEPDQCSPCLHPSAWRPTIILSLHLHLGLSSGLVPSSFPTKTLYAISSPPYVLHAPLIYRKLVFLCRGVGASSFQRHLSADLTARWKKHFLCGEYEKSEDSIILIRFPWRGIGFCYVAISDSALVCTVC